MVLFGVRFLDDDKNVVHDIRDHILVNSERDIPKLLFNVRAYVVESDVLVVHKEFIAFKNMLFIFFFMCVGALIPWLLWNFSLLFYFVFGLGFLFVLFDTPKFNFIMFIFMMKKLGYRGRVRLL